MKKLLGLFFLLAGCATAPCPPAHEVMAPRGEVLRCRPVLYRDTNEVVDACDIRLPNGKVVTRTVFKRHCGL